MDFYKNKMEAKQLLKKIVFKNTVSEAVLINIISDKYGFSKRFVFEFIDNMCELGYIKVSSGIMGNRTITPIIDESKKIKENKEESSVEDDLNGINNAQQI